MAEVVSEEEVVARELFRAVSPSVTEDMVKGFRMALGESGTELPAEFWDDLRAKLDPQDMEAILAPIYVRHLTLEEMRAALAFFRTPAGSSFAAKQGGIALETMTKMQEWMVPIVQELLVEVEKNRAEKNEPESKSLTDPARMKQTVSELRNTGTAMMSWLVDQIGSESEAGSAVPKDGELDAWRMQNHGGDTLSFRRISHQQIEALLVPQYIKEVPAMDGWGFAYEFAINADILGKSVLSMRSPGSDGKFDVADYSVGPFPMDESGQDLVWADGYFARWPQNKE